MRVVELYVASPRSATRALGAALLGCALALGAPVAAAGCASADAAGGRSPALGGGESEGDVLRVLGKPDRTFELKDESTGRRRTIWIYERRTDINGSRALRRIVLEDGRVVSDESQADPRPTVSPEIPPDRTTGRDKDW